MVTRTDVCHVIRCGADSHPCSIVRRRAVTTRKPTAKQQPSNRAAEPRASRPQIPADYGIPKSKKGLLPWSHVTERMTRAMHYWVCTISPDGHPHAMPVDGLWLDDRLYFGGSPQTRRNRNLAK